MAAVIAKKDRARSLKGHRPAACRRALLAAPHTGAETRDQLKQWGKDAQGVAGKVPNALRDAATRAAEAAKGAFHEALEAEDARELESPKPVETA